MHVNVKYYTIQTDTSHLFIYFTSLRRIRVDKGMDFHIHLYSSLLCYIKNNSLPVILNSILGNILENLREMSSKIIKLLLVLHRGNTKLVFRAL